MLDLEGQVAAHEVEEVAAVDVGRAEQLADVPCATALVGDLLLARGPPAELGVFACRRLLLGARPRNTASFTLICTVADDGATAFGGEDTPHRAAASSGAADLE
ncbi:MAG: hypothetical protein QOD59_5073 [Mycobacterium sp.]|nr:hypothetical protein [Mycobacterium sp.]